MGLQVKTTAKLAHRFRSNASFEAAHQEGGHDQADEPVSACWRFPPPRFRVAVSAINRLEVTMPAAFGKSGSFGEASDALLTIFTNRVENPNTLGPQSPIVGPYSDGWLQS
jgi:hypothetical protein